MNVFGKAAIAAGIALSVASGVAAQTKWDMPTPYPATNFHTETIAEFAKEIEQATQGKLKIVVHANGSLYKLPEIKRAVQSGQAPIGEILLSALANEDPIYAVDSIPFIAAGYTEAMKLYRAAKAVTEDRLAKSGVTLLYSVAWPPQGIYAKKEIKTSADLKGLKFRAYNPATARIAELVGAQPVTIQAAELAQALATGVVDSFISSGATGYDTKVWETLKFFHDTQAWLPRNAVIVNTRVLEALDKPTQEVVRKAAASAEQRGWKVSEEKTKWYLAQLKEKGMAVSEPSAQLAAEFKKIGETMTAEWLKTAGPDGQKIIDAFKK
jgi:TRAP-type C4-dicarboxylate transport system substrate-binding protein